MPPLRLLPVLMGLAFFTCHEAAAELPAICPDQAYQTSSIASMKTLRSAGIKRLAVILPSEVAWDL